MTGQDLPAQSNALTAPERAKTPLRAGDICVITPTKGRHKQLGCLLETLAAQTSPVGHIIIADGGHDARELVSSFVDRLPVYWLDCPYPGQIVQRNLALKNLPQFAKLVIYFDDDIQLEANAIENLLGFWNAQAAPPAGVSFNLTNMPEQPNNWFRQFFLMATAPEGRVWKSGYNSPVSNVENDVESQWLVGGATAWRRDVLETYKLADLPSVWAICEDLIFSYPISKNEQLLVCSTARVAHIDDVPIAEFAKTRVRGKSAVLWRYYFVCQNSDLSKRSFFWMNFGQIVGRFVRALTGGGAEWGHLTGTLVGVAVCLRAAVLGRDIRHELR